MTRASLRNVLRSAAGLVALGGLVLATPGCGVAADGEPHPIAAEDLPADLLDPNPPTSSTVLGSEASAVTVYLVVRQGDTTSLTPVQREVDDPASPGDRIRALLAPPSAEEQQAGLISSIPSDTVLLDATRTPDSDELVVNVSGALFDVQGKELANAFAQLVWTVTELRGVRQVWFQVDGQPQRAINAEGVEQPGAVTRADYAGLSPNR